MQDPTATATVEPESPPYQDLFMYFVAAVVVTQRRAVLEACHDCDDVLKLFQQPLKVDVAECVVQARLLRGF